MGTFLGAIAFSILLLFAIFFNELGHYVTARWAEIKITKFFVGFGPTLWSFRRGRTEIVEGEDGALTERPETEYGVKAFPLGGFVKVVGMSPFEDVPPQDVPRAFPSVPAWKRAIVLAAGSATHLVTAFLVLLLVFAGTGFPDYERPTLEVSEVITELEGRPAPAAEAGLVPGDTIVAIDGRRLSDWDALRETIRVNPDRPLDLTLLGSDGRERRVTITPAVQDEGGEQIGMIGVAPAPATTRIGPVAAVGRSVTTIGSFFAALVDAGPQLFSPRNLGLVPGSEPSDERPVSVVGAGRIAAGLAARGQVVAFLLFFVQLNLVIALLNMLPLPPLDGGHLLVLAIEKVRGKPVNPRALLPVMAVVTSLLLILAVSLLFQDIVSPVDPFQ